MRAAKGIGAGASGSGNVLSSERGSLCWLVRHFARGGPGVQGRALHRDAGRDYNRNAAKTPTPRRKD